VFYLAILTDLVNGISPYSVSNPSGSKLVIAISPILHNDLARKAYEVLYSRDGDTYDTAFVEIIGFNVGLSSETWYYKKYPDFLDRKAAKFASQVEEQVKTWWQSTGKDIYVSRSVVTVNDADLKYGSVSLVRIDGSTIYFETKYFVKTGTSTWIICDPVIVPQT
jgi:hypothetical protein